MEWHINDLSLCGQFGDPSVFRQAFEPFLKLRATDPLFRDRLFCSRSFLMRPAVSDGSLQKTVLAMNDRIYTQLVLQWVGKAGPFWDDDRQLAVDDYFEYNGTDVTDQGLGEIVRRRLVGMEANALSFIGSGFEFSPLSVQHGLREEPIGFVDVLNHWRIEQIREVLESSRTLSSWDDVRAEILRRFAGQLIVSDTATDEIETIPFSSYTADRVMILLNVLNNLVTETDETGAFSAEGVKLYADHFVGEKAWFSDESEDNKVKFKQKMTFADPIDKTKFLFCPFHGKIKSPLQIRIHFEWQRPAGQREIKVLYIGPKITKH